MAFESRSEIEARIKATARRAFKKLAPVDGTYAFAVTGVNKMEQPAKGDADGNGAGCISLAVRVAPMKTPGDLGTVQNHLEATIWLNLPIVNPDVEGHTVDQTTTNKSTSLLSAFAPDRVPYVSKKNPDGTWDNSKETKARIQAAQVEAAVYATEIAENPDLLKDVTFVATTKQAPADKGGYYLNGITPELTSGKSFGELADASN
jgi:hypothetical protein